LLTFNRTLRGYINRLAREEAYASSDDIELDVTTFSSWAQRLLGQDVLEHDPRDQSRDHVRVRCCRRPSNEDPPGSARHRDATRHPVPSTPAWTTTAASYGGSSSVRALAAVSVGGGRLDDRRESAKPMGSA
jgi:hypothetical protein